MYCLYYRQRQRVAGQRPDGLQRDTIHEDWQDEQRTRQFDREWGNHVWLRDTGCRLKGVARHFDHRRGDVRHVLDTYGRVWSELHRNGFSHCRPIDRYQRQYLPRWRQQHGLRPDERQRWERHLGQLVGRAEWERAAYSHRRTIDGKTKNHQ